MRPAVRPATSRTVKAEFIIPGIPRVLRFNFSFRVAAGGSTLASTRLCRVLQTLFPPRSPNPNGVEVRLQTTK